MRVRQVTRGPGGRILTNVGAWSPDGASIVYDTRSDAAGEVFDGTRIETVNVETGEVRVLHRAPPGAACGIASYHPRDGRVAFVAGPERPTADWSYAPWHRRGVVVDGAGDRTPVSLDARDLLPPYTPGALRGGTHLHVWDGAGEWVSFTYEDHVLAVLGETERDRDLNQRNVGVSMPARPVRVAKGHPRNHDGESFSVLVTRTFADPRPGSDEIERAFEEGWVGTNGYRRPDGSRQRRAIAFQGQVVTADGRRIAEVFVADLPDDPTRAGDGPLAGTATRRPLPPLGTTQRRLTFTARRTFPGLQGPRHWLRSSPDGSRIAFLMKDDAGIAQLWTVSPSGGEAAPLTRNSWPIASAFTWSPDGRRIAHVMDTSVSVTDAATGETTRLTARTRDDVAPRPEACVFSPDGRRIACVCRVPSPAAPANQVFVVE